MVFTNVGKAAIALMMATGSGVHPRYAAIGSGSGTALATQTALTAEISGLRTDYTSFDSGTTQQIEWTHDFNSVKMSGITMNEFALFSNLTFESGTMFSRVGFENVEFDGSNELQLQIRFETY